MDRVRNNKGNDVTCFPTNGAVAVQKTDCSRAHSANSGVIES